MMYVQGSQEDGVRRWVDIVHDLRYKDYQLAVAPAAMTRSLSMGTQGTLEEMTTVKELGQKFDQAGLLEWWRKGMGFAKDD